MELLRYIYGRDSLGHAMHRHPLTAWTLLKEGIIAFIDDSALTRGAAIAFYAVTAIAPVLFIMTAIAAVFLGQTAASGAVHHQLTRIMSSESADLVQLAILHLRNGAHTLAGSLIGIVALVVTASGFFTEIEDALNVIWKAPRHESYFYQLLRGRVLSLALVVGLGILLLASMVLATGIRLLDHILDRYTDIAGPVISAVNISLSYVIVSLIFAAIYKVLPNARLMWRDVLVASFGTALLFEAGQTLIGYYLANFITANIYGAAGGIIVLLVWVYYSAQIFLLGAEFTKVWAMHYGSRTKGMEP
ncbi:MAG TPA: YihY/virulence factor BrkB family protein [Rhizomicrobium sp.]|nr:YihY/virulence factor BrkB family protein [Rhizomicrobium sp.]